MSARIPRPFPLPILSILSSLSFLPSVPPPWLCVKFSLLLCAFAPLRENLRNARAKTRRKKTRADTGGRPYRKTFRNAHTKTQGAIGFLPPALRAGRVKGPMRFKRTPAVSGFGPATHGPAPGTACSLTCAFARQERRNTPNELRPGGTQCCCPGTTGCRGNDTPNGSSGRSGTSSRPG